MEFHNYFQYQIMVLVLLILIVSPALVVAKTSIDNEIITYEYNVIVNANKEFIASLSPEQKNRVIQPYDSPYRDRGFCYVIKQCYNTKGLRIFDLSADQKVLLNKVLLSLTNSLGYRKTVAIMDRQAILFEMESGYRVYPEYLKMKGPTKVDLDHGANPNFTPPKGRSNLEYNFTIFGDIDSGKFAIRFEGHHFSLNATFEKKDDSIKASPWPLFLGASPMIVPKSPTFEHLNLTAWKQKEGNATLWGQTLAARALVMSLTNEQRQQSNWGSGPASLLYGDAQDRLSKSVLNMRIKSMIAANQLSNLSNYLLKQYIQEYTDVFKPILLTQFDSDEFIKQAKISWWCEDLDSDYSRFYLRVVSGKYLVEISQDSGYSVVTPGYQAIHIHSAFRNLKEDWDTNVIKSHLLHEHPHQHKH